MVDARTRVYLALVYAAAVAFLAFAIAQRGGIAWSPLVTFAGLAFISESLAVDMPRTGKVSVSFSIHLSALLIFGPTLAALAAAAGEFNWPDIAERKPFYKLAFNASQAVLSVAGASAVYETLGGLYGAGWGFPGSLVPTVGASVAFLLINNVLLSSAIALSEQIALWNVLRANSILYAGNDLALTVLAVIMVKVYLTVGPAGLLLLVAPLLVARQTLQVYMKLREAYQGTVRSLVAAIEAKDAYTRGHSERVADYSEQIARQLHLPEDDIDKLKFAALLHDLGKIGIQRRILSKVGRLSPDEFTLMREHPELAATILRNVEFLEDVIPTIYHHHEHYNGDGYQGRLRGEQIPLAARILSVADAYDAMTSARPYRGALTPEAAAAELVSCCGSQFDRRAVNALLAAVEVQPEPAGVSELAKGQLSIIEETN